MSFCSNCGTKIPTNGQFCPSCGKNVNSSITTDNKSRTKFEGQVHKCPNCGEVISSFSSYCPSCNFEIRSESVVETINDFILKLQKASSKEEKCTIISLFPVPNTREDLLEFMILGSTNFNFDSYVIDGNKSISYAWLLKMEQCYKKAQYSFNNHNDFFQIEKIYNDINENIQEKTKKRKTERIVVIIAFVIIFFASVINEAPVLATSVLFTGPIYALVKKKRDKKKSKEY